MPIISVMSFAIRLGLVFILFFAGHLTRGSFDPSSTGRLQEVTVTEVPQAGVPPTILTPSVSRLRIAKKTFTLPETVTVDAGAYLDSEETSNPGHVVSFQWICLKNETEIKATNFHYYTNNATSQCFFDHEPSGRTSGPLFEMSARHFRFRFLPQSYFLYVIVSVSKGNVTSYVIVDVVMVTVVTGPRPVVTITCIANCVEYLNPLMPLALAADCSNCDPSEVLNYVWSIQPAANNNTIMDLDWKTSSMSGNKHKQVVLKVGTFLDVDKNETYIMTVIVIREDGSHGMAVRPLKISDEALSRLSVRAVNHKAPTKHTTDRSWTAVYICIGAASLSIIIVIGVVLSYRKLSVTRHRVLPVSSPQQPETKQTKAEGAIDSSGVTAAVDVTAVGAAASPPPPFRPAAATASSIMSSASMTIPSDAESFHSQRTY